MIVLSALGIATKRSMDHQRPTAGRPARLLVYRNDNPAKQTTNMKRYQLFSEFCDAAIWGNDLVDALRRAKELPRKVPVVAGIPVVKTSEPFKIKTVLGTRDTTGSTRGQWKYEAAIVEAEDGTIHQVDAREDGTLIPAPQG